ncbi:CoA-disulfide reductase [Clostridiaceae bacterium]|nr:CoA-disulfide reductase [Clostridiaceae bacterium]RKI17969.1 CoA-disulfide reductase [bacterium 1XD21-70]
MKVIIVGGVAGGAGTAARLRRNDESAEIIMLERGDYISYANCGLPYYVGGVITDKGALQVQTPERFHDRFRVDVRVGSEVTFVDTKEKSVTVRHGEETYQESYDKLVLSPGAGPVRPPILGMEENHVFTLRNIPDTYAVHDYVEKEKPATCAVIGAGFIGLEMAENLAKRGIRVSVVEGAAHVMPPIDMDMAHGVHNYIRAQGIRLYLGQTCTAMDREGVVLSDGTKVLADMVILSIGVRPDTGFLKGSGISLGQRGEILVNEFMETSEADVYALGDAVAVNHVVSGRQVLIPLASPANKQGRIVGDNLCGKRVAYKGSQGTSIMKFFGMTVAVTGEKEESLAAQGRPYGKVVTTSASQAGYYPGGEMMTVKTLFDPKTGVILGAQIVGGKGVDKRIDDLANAVRFCLTGYDLQEMELAYAPPFSSAKDPVNMAGYVIGNVLEGVMRPFYIEDLDKIPEDAIRLDVRTDEEVAGGMIPGFIHIPLDSLRERMGELDLAKDIYITCQIGLRGYLAQRILDQAGARTWNLSGGYRFYDMMVKDQADAAAVAGMCTECGMEKK